jgi:hypothetical protein
VKNSLQVPSGYPELLQELKSRIQNAQVRAAFAVSHGLFENVTGGRRFKDSEKRKWQSTKPSGNRQSKQERKQPQNREDCDPGGSPGKESHPSVGEMCRSRHDDKGQQVCAQCKSDGNAQKIRVCLKNRNVIWKFPPSLTITMRF